MSANMEPLPNIIEPRWWTGELPIAAESFTIDCSAYTMHDAMVSRGSALGDRMNALFDEIGLVYLTNTGLSDLADMQRSGHRYNVQSSRDQ